MKKLLGPMLLPLLMTSPVLAIADTTCEGSGNLVIVSATDDGLYDEDAHGPEKTIDGNLSPDSRWSNESQGAPKQIVFDLGAVQKLKSVGIAWYNGDKRWSEFAVDASVDGKAYASVLPLRKSSGKSKEIEPHAFNATDARYFRISAKGNAANNWNSIVEVVAYGCGVAVAKPATPVLTARKGSGLFGLHPDRAPGKNFDLLGWYMTTPADADGNGTADSVMEKELAAGWTDPNYFYTDPFTGGMVFRSTAAGAKTSANTHYSRSELRGMLRRGDESIPVRVDGGFPNKNNWVLSSAPESARAKAGGVDGIMKATLAVNQVTRQGKAGQVGRVIIGQIHAKDDEPIRLYYRKLPGHKFGSIYFAHDPATGKEQWVEIIGSRSDRAPNPEHGIALDEVFSYEIETRGVIENGRVIPMLYVKIIRDDGSEISAKPFDMRNSGFSVDNDFMFFKAGAYSQNNSSPVPERDFDQVTFYKLQAQYSHALPDFSKLSKNGAALTPPAMAAPVATAPAAIAALAKKTVAKMTSIDASAFKTIATTALTPGGRVVLDDSFANGNRNNWWTTTASNAIEVTADGLGLVSGGSGRGIRATFAPQKLEEGQSIKATFSFTTPATIGTDQGSAFRVGLYNKLGRQALEGDLSASSKEPNTAYDGLPGYMIDFDVNLSDATAAKISIRKHNADTIGRLLGTTKGYSRLGGGGKPYRFEPKQTYTGVMRIKKLGAGMQISGSLSHGGAVVSTFDMVDEKSDVNDFGMLAFHVNSKTFGSSSKAKTPDNGLQFKRVSVEVLQ